MIASLLNIPVIYTVHGWSFHKENQSWLTYRLRTLSEKIICKFSKQVICVSKSNYQTGQQVFSLQQAEIINNGINLDKFNPNRNFNNIRKELNMDSNDFVIALIGRITAQKDPLTFIKSIQIANAQNSHIKGLLVGEGDLKEEAIKYIQEHNLSSIFYICNFRKDVPDLLNAIQVFCLPSLWEGLSIALLEAMAMKKAIVATPTDGTIEIIIPEINGKIAPFNNPKALSQMYLEYLKKPTIMIKYGNNAYDLVSQKYNSQDVSKKVSHIYQTIVNR